MVPNVTSVTLNHKLTVSAPRPTVAVEGSLNTNTLLSNRFRFVLGDESSREPLAPHVSSPAEFASNCHFLILR